MRILLAAEHLGRAGGMERYLQIVLPALVAHGARVHVLARTLDEVPPGVTAESIGWADEHDEPDAGARALAERARDAFRPDVAVLHNVMDAGIVEAFCAVARTVYHVHDHRPFCPNGDRLYPWRQRTCTRPLGTACMVHALVDGCGYGPRARTLALLRRRERLRDAIARCDVTIVASAYVAARAHDSGIPADRLVTLPLPLPDEAYAAMPPAPGARSVVFAGRAVPQKGLDALVRALALLPAERRPLLRAFGGGPLLARVKEQAARTGVALDAPGEATPETVRDAIDGAALVALPSRWAEPFGYVGIEAFARGRPVVAFAVGGVDAWLADGVNGIAVPAGDDVALAAPIRALLDDHERCERLGRRARSDAERFRAAPILETLFRLYGGKPA
jgi:glycosyltransferase involved in cell wall biosynthesis